MIQNKAACRFAKIIKLIVNKELGNDIFLNVNPAKIKLYSTEPYYSFKNYWQRKRRFESLINLITNKYDFIKRLYFIPGDWDMAAIPFKNYHTYKHMEEIHSKNYDYQKTEHYKELIAKIEIGEVPTYKHIKMKSKEDVIDSYFKWYIKIFKNMEQEGYISNKGSTSIVAIGRDGDLIKVIRGRHRLAIAQILGIESITVKVDYIHPEWLAKQFKETSTKSPVDILHNSLKLIQSKYR